MSYAYDNRGNLTHDGVYTYTWNAAGRLVKAESITHTIVYTYNGDDVRVASAADGTVTRYVQDTIGLPQVLAETTGGATVLYLYGVSRLAQVRGNDAEWFLGDALGSVRQLVDEDGAIVLSRDYDPYGQMVSADGTGSSGYGFTGEQFDRYTQFVFLRARYYRPEIGEFVSKDPYSGLLSEPQSMNGWGYVHGNPVNRTDPSGECVFSRCRYPGEGVDPGDSIITTIPVRQPSSLTSSKREVCGSWPAFKGLCERAYDGDLGAKERAFEMIASAEPAVGLAQASRALRHFLKGTTTPGQELYFSARWYLYWYGDQAKIERDILKSTLRDEALKDGGAGDRVQRSTKIVARTGINFNPIEIKWEFADFTIDMDDRQLVVGEHSLHGRACYDPGGCLGQITYKFSVYEWFDFRKLENNMFIIPHTGFKVPTYWADQLVDSNRAAEYWTIIKWTETEWVIR